jgi:precorrin-6B methylase 2
MKRTLSATIAVLLVTAAYSTGQEIARGAGESHPISRVPDAVFIPTPQDVVDAMLELADVHSNDVVYDLGCGDGRIVITAAKRYGCRAAGLDIDELRVEQSRENVQKTRLSDIVKIEHQDVLKADLRPASVITLYLTPKLNAKLIPQFERMRPGSRIVAHESAIPGF